MIERGRHSRGAGAQPGVRAGRRHAQAAITPAAAAAPPVLSAPSPDMQLLHFMWPKFGFRAWELENPALGLTSLHSVIDDWDSHG